MSDVKEVENIMENIGWLKSQMAIAISNWQGGKPNCSIGYSGILGDICRNPNTFSSKVFDPLTKWLADYVLNREGKIAFTGAGGLDFFLKQGLRHISNFIVVADFFSKNPYYFVPNPPISVSNLQANKEAGEKQKIYQDFINTLSSKLIGCNDQLGFIFLKLSKTIKSLPSDLAKMQSYLESQCLSYRIRSI